MRIVITGPPQAGKTFLATQLAQILGIPLFHTDSVKDLDWSAASQEVSTWFDRDPAQGWIIEGVTVPRALRKWHVRNPEKTVPPFDRFVYIKEPRKTLQLSGQRTMANQVWETIKPYRQWIGERWVEL